jgi:hypothetical protein
MRLTSRRTIFNGTAKELTHVLMQDLQKMEEMRNMIGTLPSEIIKAINIRQSILQLIPTLNDVSKATMENVEYIKVLAEGTSKAFL